VTVLLLNVLFVGYAWTRKKFNHVWTVKLLRTSSGLLMGILYIPVLSTLGSSLVCDGISPNLCNGLRPVSALLILFFIMFGLANTSTLNDGQPASQSQNALQSPHSRVAMFQMLVRSVLALLSSTLPYLVEPDANALIFVHVWIGFMVVSSVSLTCMYIYLQPFYSRIINDLNAVLYGLISWTAIAMAFNGMLTGYDGNDSNHVVLYFGGLVLLLPLILVCITWRRSHAPSPALGPSLLLSSLSILPLATLSRPCPYNCFPLGIICCPQSTSELSRSPASPLSRWSFGSVSFCANRGPPYTTRPHHTTLCLITPHHSTSLHFSLLRTISTIAITIATVITTTVTIISGRRSASSCPTIW
jgi:hypothetical protein